MMTALRTHRRFSPGWLVLAVVAAAFVAPAWTVGHWPSQDGPEHVYNALVLRSYGGPGGAAFRPYFQVSHRPVPNWLTHLVLAALMGVASPAVADKLVVTALVVLFLVAARYVGGAGRGGDRGGWVLLLPLALNVFLFAGFYNFCAGLVAVLFVVGYWVRRADAGLTWPQVGVLVGLVTLTYVCHIVPFLIVGLLLAVAAGYDLVLGGRRLGRAVRPWVAVVPGVALSVAFLAGQPSKIDYGGYGLAFRVARLADWADTFVRVDGLISAAVTLGLLALTASVVRARVRRRGADRSDVVLVTAGLTFGLSLACPAAIAGGSWVVERVSFLAVLAWAAWAAVQRPADAPFGRRGWAALVAGVGVATAVLLGRTAMRVVRQDRALRAYVSAAAYVRPGSTVLPVPVSSAVPGSPGYFGRHGFNRFDPMLHAVGWVAAERGAVEATDYEAATGYFPLRFQPGMDPTPILGTITPAAYARFTKGRGHIDAVVRWRTGDGPSPVPADQALDADLAANYRRVYRSAGEPHVEVYRRLEGTAKVSGK